MFAIAVSYQSDAQREAANRLAAKLGAPLLPPHAEQFTPLLQFTDTHLAFSLPGTKMKPFFIDFLSPTWHFRLKQASLRKEALARAIGIRPRENPTLIDATAGLGRDSFLLAALGYHVILLERSPIIHALLDDALRRARIASPIVDRMSLLERDAIHYLANQSADIVYLDPMFPEREKSAKVKKEMIILQQLLGKEAETDELLNAALACATKRVVVKRPRLASPIANQSPSFSLTGNSCRFDVYIR